MHNHSALRNHPPSTTLSPVTTPANADPLHSATVQRTVIKVRADGQLESAPDTLAAEEPLEIRVQSQSIAITMRTPGHDEELALGFLISEGLITTRQQVTHIAHCQSGEAAMTGNVLNVFTADDVALDFDKLTRHVFASSSCGLCGKASIAEVHQHFPPIATVPQVHRQILLQLPRSLREQQSGFEQTGGLHAAALFDLQGNLIVCREDVGRHNAVDKVIGYALENEVWPLENHILQVSGRASFEILQKALAARIPIVAAVSAPSSLAVDFATESGQLLIGFLRGETMNLYSHAEAVIC
ncbi:MAG: formate dehydrogenase accessory protein [Verrucomicrobia bacterium]|jgi:FdhD protein|nr:formate dehydrogenase accessory protein [Verrucomicrobiota bacterium]